MAKSYKQSVLQLANEAGIEIDEALIRLWDGGFNDVSYPTDILSGSRLNQAKKCLGVATKKQLTSLSYWQNYLCLSESDFIQLLGGW